MSDEGPRTFGKKLREFFLRNAALRDARAQLPGRDGPAGRALGQARLLREVARQVTEPMEELPPGRRAAVLLPLYRDLVYWALVAERRGETEWAPNLETLWERTDADRLLRAAGSAPNLEALRGTLVDMPGAPPLDADDAEVARAHVFAESLFADLEAPRRRVNRVLRQRWLRLAPSGVAILAVVLVIRAIALGPDLAAGKSFRVSSTFPGCASDASCAEQMFHTTLEDNPWVEIDLGATKSIHRAEVKNRGDCCQERAIPMVLELSTDRASWREVGRRNTEFKNWTVKFPLTSARYVRLSVRKSTMFHLKDVAIR